AICSLSAEPPMLAVCLNKSSSAYQTVSNSAFFAVNILNNHQAALADAFAGRIAPDLRFQEGERIEGETGTPVLMGSVASFECELEKTVDAATHMLFVGLVRSVHDSMNTEPLLYHDRRYRQCG